MTPQNAPQRPETPPTAPGISQNAIDAVTVVIAVLLASGAVYCVVQRIAPPDWYVLLLGTVVSFAFGRASGR
jgi:hypothetical protein